MGRYRFKKNGSPQSRKKYERICKCGCDNFIDTTQDKYIKTNIGAYHFDCYVRYLMSDKNTLPENIAIQEAEKLAKKTEEENLKKSLEIKLDSDFDKWLLGQYGLMKFSSRFYEILNNVYKGTYKNMRVAIKKEHLRDMWNQKMTYLNKVNERNKSCGKSILGEKRAIYDLSILINKYDDYLAWIQKNEIKDDVSKEIIKFTDNKTYNNLICIKQPKNEQQDDVDEWF